jgi:hypothetical protein
MGFEMVIDDRWGRWFKEGRRSKWEREGNGSLNGFLEGLSAARKEKGTPETKDPL